MKESILVLIRITNIHQAVDSRTAKPSKTLKYSHPGRNAKVRRAAENQGRGLECNNVA